MNRIDLKDKNNFIGCWNIDNNDLCEKIINFFENNKSLQKKGTTVSGINEKAKKSIDISIDPKNLNNHEFDDIKNYFNELFKCYQDYKIQWPFLDKTLDVVDIPKFNIQKYNKLVYSPTFYLYDKDLDKLLKKFALNWNQEVPFP